MHLSLTITIITFRSVNLSVRLTDTWGVTLFMHVQRNKKFEDSDLNPADAPIGYQSSQSWIV